MATIENNTAGNTKRKAAAFINIHAVSSKNPENTKSLGGVPLYADNIHHAALIKHLQDGGKVTLETGIHIVSTESDFEY